jgi:hypothetical protein
MKEPFRSAVGPRCFRETSIVHAEDRTRFEPTSRIETTDEVGLNSQMRFRDETVKRAGVAQMKGAYP